MRTTSTLRSLTTWSLMRALLQEVKTSKKPPMPTNSFWRYHPRAIQSAATGSADLYNSIGNSLV